jgi:hypothetical protein
MASAGLQSIGDHQLLGFLPVKHIYFASDRIGQTVARVLGEPRGT